MSLRPVGVLGRVASATEIEQLLASSLPPSAALSEFVEALADPASSTEILRASLINDAKFGRITDAINTALRELLRKSGLVDGVLIDPSDLSVTLLDDDDQPLDAQRLSAGERQIVATAVLWGLSQCTGMTLPTVIDSPVGRLDRSHRTNLVDRYFPQASRQVVLLSTDEEIVGEHLQQLLPWVGAQYRLDFDEVEGFTSVEEGYFDD